LLTVRCVEAVRAIGHPPVDRAWCQGAGWFGPLGGTTQSLTALFHRLRIGRRQLHPAADKTGWRLPP